MYMIRSDACNIGQCNRIPVTGPTLSTMYGTVYTLLASVERSPPFRERKFCRCGDKTGYGSPEIFDTNDPSITSNPKRHRATFHRVRSTVSKLISTGKTNDVAILASGTAVT
mmetsp:Transcript_57156/g.68346  ORF Transcript_57156/g.68346 Transcript_57156/m.68346 type:complete len:112 (+) Transcript_57156:1620-1955(+)